MVSRLERWAEDARKNGFPQEADLIENQTKVFRKAGVPEEFPQEEVGVEAEAKGRTTEEPLTLRDAKVRLVGVLSSAKYERGKPILTPELAKKLHHTVKDSRSIPKIYTDTGFRKIRANK